VPPEHRLLAPVLNDDMLLWVLDNDAVGDD